MRLMLEIVNAPEPLLVSVTFCPALVIPTVWPPKFSVEGESETSGAVPVPLREMVCGLPGALSAMSTWPVMLPVAAGVKESVMVQVEVGCKAPTVLQVLLLEAKEKSAGVPTLGSMLTAEIVSVWFPEFVRVMLGAVEGVPTLTLPKESEVCDRLAAGWVPVPLRLIDCGLLAALSAMVTEAKREPVACGAKPTAITQEAFGAMPVPPVEQVVCALSWKSTAFVPVMPRLLRTRFALPVLVSVAVCTAETVPTWMLPKVMVVAERLATAPVPVPETGTFCGLGVLEELSAMLILALAAPMAAGAKFTAITQEPPLGPTPAPPMGHVVCAELIWNSLAFVPIGAMLVMFRVPVPVFVKVKLIGEEVVPTV